MCTIGIHLATLQLKSKTHTIVTMTPSIAAYHSVRFKHDTYNHSDSPHAFMLIPYISYSITAQCLLICHRPCILSSTSPYTPQSTKSGFRPPSIQLKQLNHSEHSDHSENSEHSNHSGYSDHSDHSDSSDHSNPSDPSDHSNYLLHVLILIPD